MGLFTWDFSNGTFHMGLFTWDFQQYMLRLINITLLAFQNKYGRGYYTMDSMIID